VIGAGPIGCEMAQTFQRLGSGVVLLHRNDHILDREDADAAEIVRRGSSKKDTPHPEMLHNGGHPLNGGDPL
jgi:pyruvate/2-oxoglutarate dehydrogenase complex dihydrolipoamide dehydrogenase (E3) component